MHTHIPRLEIKKNARIELKEKESTISRLGLQPSDADAVIVAKERAPQRDTRKKTIKTIKVKPAGEGGGGGGPESPKKKKRKKKKLKLDPKGERKIVTLAGRAPSSSFYPNSPSTPLSFFQANTLG